MSPRYITSDDVSHDCCHEAVVLDTADAECGKPKMMCECFYPEDAELIARALNALAEVSSGLHGQTVTNS